MNLPKAGAWMTGIKWVGGVRLAYLALTNFRDALPKETVRSLAQPGTRYGIAGAVVFGASLALAGVHVAAERRKSRIARLSNASQASARRADNRRSPHGASHGGNSRNRLSFPVADAATAMAVSSPPELRWESSESAAVARASSEHKPFAGRLWGELVRSLQRARREDDPRPRVRVEGASWVARYVDATNDDDPSVARVREPYGAAAGLPVLLLFDDNGKEALRFTEFVAPDRLAAALSSAR